MAELSERLQAALAATYRIERALGGGGMSATFLAEELALGRRVVIKVLLPELVYGLSGERFRREIHLAASLQHPHIVPLFAAGEADGLLYYTMPWISGESLRERLVRDSRLAVSDVVRILREVVDALAYAHAQGIVHRDIKPGNVLLSGSHALVADFGVAKALSAAGPRDSETLTGGRVLGTPGYMAPEQAAGGRIVDGRADLYALGIMGYEMLVGTRPFPGTTPQAVFAAQLAGPPEHLSHVCQVPPLLANALMRCLEMRPENRWQTASRLGRVLRAVGNSDTGAPADASATYPAAISTPAKARAFLNSRRTRTVSVAAVGAAVLAGAFLARGSAKLKSAALDPPESPRIAVLYFDDLSADRSLRYMADAITDELINELSGVRAFRVISRDAVRPYRDRDVPFDTLVARLHATTLVDGSVQRSGNRVRVRAQLIDANSLTYVDSLSVTRSGGETELWERELAVELAAALRRQMGREARLRAARSGGGSREASDLVFRAQRERENAKTLFEQPRSEDVRAAFEALERADSLLILAEAADSAWVRPVLDRGWVAHDRAQREAGAARVPTVRTGLALAEEALRRAPDDPGGLELRGSLRWLLASELQAAPEEPEQMRVLEADLRRALDQDSTRAAAWARLAFVLWFRGSTAEAELAARRALLEDTYLVDALDVLYELFFSSLLLGDFERAGQWCERGRLTFPRHWRFVHCRLLLLRHDTSHAPDPDLAWGLVDELERLDPARRAVAEGRPYHPIARRMIAAAVSARAGRHDIARAELARAKRLTAGDSVLRVDLLYDQAYLRLLAGDRAGAANLLDAYGRARPLARGSISRDPLFNGLRLFHGP
jgi:serine/threonine-protein kinase